MKLRRSAKRVSRLVPMLGVVWVSLTQGILRAEASAQNTTEKVLPAQLSPASGSAPQSIPAEYPAQVILLPPTPAVTNAETPPPVVRLSPWASEVEKLAHAGIPDEVMLTFVDSAGSFNLTSEQIIRLHDAGLSSQVISRILQHDTEIVSGRRQATASLPPPPQTMATEAPPTPRGEAVQSPPHPSSAVHSIPPADSGQAYVWKIVDEGSGLTWTLLDESTELDAHQQDRLPPTRPASTRRFPVREPYAVQLTDPVLVVRAEARVPNLRVIVPFP